MDLPISSTPPYGAGAALYFLDENSQMLFCRYNKQTGSIQSKFIHPDDVRAAIAGFEFDSGWISHEMLRFGNSPLGRWTVTVHPARVTQLILDGETITIPLPKTVMICRHTLVRLFAVNNGKVTPDSKLYKYPLPHVGGEGSICWGNVDRAETLSPSELLDLFLSSGFSGHSVANKSKEYPEDVRCLLRKLSTERATQYPLQDMPLLAINGRTHTLDSFLNEVIKNG